MDAVSRFFACFSYIYVKINKDAAKNAVIVKEQEY